MHSSSIKYNSIIVPLINVLLCFSSKTDLQPGHKQQQGRSEDADSATLPCPPLLLIWRTLSLLPWCEGPCPWTRGCWRCWWCCWPPSCTCWPASRCWAWGGPDGSTGNHTCKLCCREQKSTVQKVLLLFSIKRNTCSQNHPHPPRPSDCLFEVRY